LSHPSPKPSPFQIPRTLTAQRLTKTTSGIFRLLLSGTDLILADFFKFLSKKEDLTGLSLDNDFLKAILKGVLHTNATEEFTTAFCQQKQSCRKCRHIRKRHVQKTYKIDGLLYGMLWNFLFNLVWI
jgi:hypothetical protein